jgi:TPR repeat protein
MMLFATLMLLAAAPPSPAKDTADLEKACAKGKASACDELGNRYHYGVGVRPSDNRAVDLFKKACHGKSPEGCADAALTLALGLEQKPDPQTALAQLEKLCAEGVARACGNLGLLYNEKMAGQDKVARGETMMADACRKGDLASCSNVSAIAFERGDTDRFEKYGHAACDNGHADGCAQLGDKYISMQQPVRAASAYAAACQLGSVRGCTDQALSMLDAGADHQKALALLDQSCQLGDPQACDAARRVRDADTAAAAPKRK